ncbi:cell division control protein 11 [Pancytospora epiphaga]|nr:cell division control protein 11 [Pancytospora epiphaga]
MQRRDKRFTIMVAGAIGSGKSTLLNNIVARQIISNKSQSEIDVYMLNLDGIGVRRNIVFIDTPGFGSAMNDEMIQDSISAFIREQFDAYIEEEVKTRRNPNYEDTRVHCLLYLIPATGNGLKLRDVVFLKKVAPYVNIIPVISKGDALSEAERVNLRKLINEQLVYYSIEIFEFSDGENLPQSDDGLRNLDAFPFITVCSGDYNAVETIKNHPAGRIEIDDPNHSDLVLLREALLDKYMETLIETTAVVLYEKYRTKVLESMID